MEGPGPVVEVVDLVKVYAGGTRALDGISFAVRGGAFVGLLGPNGAGKTTTIRILATLLRPTDGSAAVMGLDVVRDAGAVRRRIGFAMQTVAVDAMSTGRENLELIGHLHRVPGPALRERVDELLQLMNLTGVAGKLAGTYSGGMRRRLDLASALVHKPDVLFLDEPTEGLDPQSRNALWEELIRINRGGTTMVLTTHYMEEADRLCSQLAIIDVGRIVVEGSPIDLKRSIGEDTVELRLVDDGDGRADPAIEGDAAGASLAAAQDAVIQRLEGFESLTGVDRTAAGLALAVRDADRVAPALFRRLEGDGMLVRGFAMSRPTLDDVFLRYTGKRIRDEPADQTIELGW